MVDQDSLVNLEEYIKAGSKVWSAEESAAQKENFTRFINGEMLSVVKEGSKYFFIQHLLEPINGGAMKDLKWQVMSGKMREAAGAGKENLQRVSVLYSTASLCTGVPVPTLMTMTGPDLDMMEVMALRFLRW